MATVQGELEEMENLGERVKYSGNTRRQAYMPPSIYVPIQRPPSRSTTPPQTPGLSTGASSPPSQFPSSPPFSDSRRKSAEYIWEFSNDPYEAPPLTATASEFSELEDPSFDFHSETYSSIYEDVSEHSPSATKYRDSSDVLIAAEALIMFSHCPLEKIPGPSSLPSPLSSDSIPPGTQSASVSPIENEDELRAGTSCEGDAQKTPVEVNILSEQAGRRSPTPCRSTTPTSPRPQFKRFLSNLSSTSLVIPSSPSHRPRKKSKATAECTEIAAASTDLASICRSTHFDVDSDLEANFACEKPLDFPKVKHDDLFTLQDQEHTRQTSPELHVSPCSIMDTAELQGHIISILALSRSSSLTSTAIARQLLSNQPGILAQRSKGEWTDAINTILEERDCDKPVFSRVERVGKDAASRRLENQYFYNPENDPDQGRAEILREMVPKKRGVTKQHRQYYFAPIGKNKTKWDHDAEF